MMNTRVSLKCLIELVTMTGWDGEGHKRLLFYLRSCTACTCPLTQRKDQVGGTVTFKRPLSGCLLQYAQGSAESPMSIFKLKEGPRHPKEQTVGTISNQDF